MIFNVFKPKKITEKVFKIINGTQESAQFNWKIIVGDKGHWGYTSSKIEIGDTVEFFEVNDKFKFYVKSINGKLTRKFLKS